MVVAKVISALYWFLNDTLHTRPELGAYKELVEIYLNCYPSWGVQRLQCLHMKLSNRDVRINIARSKTKHIGSSWRVALIFHIVHKDRDRQ